MFMMKIFCSVIEMKRFYYTDHGSPFGNKISDEMPILLVDAFDSDRITSSSLHHVLPLTS